VQTNEAAGPPPWSDETFRPMNGRRPWPGGNGRLQKTAVFAALSFISTVRFPAFSGGARPFPIGHLSEGGHIK